MSDQDWADKAAFEIAKMLMFSPDAKVKEDVYCRDIAAIIRSSAPDARLITAVKAMILLIEDYEAKTCKVIRAAITIGKSDWQAEAKERELAMHKMFEFLDTLRAALSETKAVCEWEPSEYDGEITHYDGTCGSAIVYLEGGLAAHGYNFCPKCGLPIAEQPRDTTLTITDETENE